MAPTSKPMPSKKNQMIRRPKIDADAHKQRDHPTASVIYWLFFALVKERQQFLHLGGVVKVLCNLDHRLTLAFALVVEPIKYSQWHDDAREDAKKGNNFAHHAASLC